MDVEKMSALIALVAVALIYLTGYAYLDGFYEFYDVPLSELNFGIQFVAAHSMIPLKGAASYINSLLLVLSILLVTYLVSIVRTTNWNPLKSTQSKNFLVAFSICSLVASVMIAFSAPALGYQNAKRDFRSLNRAVVFGGEASIEINALLSRIDGSSLHYLVSANDTHIFVVKFSKSERRWTHQVSADSIAGFRVFQNAQPSGNVLLFSRP